MIILPFWSIDLKLKRNIVLNVPDQLSQNIGWLSLESYIYVQKKL